MTATVDQVTLIKTASVSVGCLLGSVWPVRNPFDNFLFMRGKTQSSCRQSILLFQSVLNASQETSVTYYGVNIIRITVNFTCIAPSIQEMQLQVLKCFK